MRGNSDGMIVIFVSDLEQFQDQKRSQDKILNKIWQLLKACQLAMKLPAKMEVQRFRDGLIFQLSTKWQSITFKVLPAYNALGEFAPGCVQGTGLERCVETAKPKKGAADSYVGPLGRGWFRHHWYGPKPGTTYLQERRALLR